MRTARLLALAALCCLAGTFESGSTGTALRAQPAERNVWGAALLGDALSSAGPLLPAAGAQPSPVVDGEGDAFDVFGAGPPLHDIDTIVAEFNASELVVAISFHTVIAAPSSGAFDAAVGLLEIDSDQNPGTGAPALQNQFSPPLPGVVFGSDYIVDLSSEFFQPGLADVIEVATLSLAGTVPVTFTSSTIEFAVPLALLGGDDGLVDVTATFGSFAQPTDAMNVVGTSVSEGDLFFRGDCNGDSVLNITDAIYHLDIIAGAPWVIGCEDACDNNDDGSLDIADPIFSLNFIYLGGPPLPAPYPGCGSDSSGDDLGCESYSSCSS